MIADLVPFYEDSLIALEVVSVTANDPSPVDGEGELVIDAIFAELGIEHPLSSR